MRLWALLRASYIRSGGLRAEWRNGRDAGFPVCCIAHFCWDAFLGRYPGQIRGGTDDGYVPCARHRPRTPGLSLTEDEFFAALAESQRAPWKERS